MMNNDGDSQSDDLSNEDPEERRPSKEKKKNLPIVDSDKEDSQLESDNEMDRSVDFKEKKSNKENKKRPVIVNKRNLPGNLYYGIFFTLFFTRKDALSYFVTTNGEPFDSGS